ncbi:MAG: permease [Verrucomicrobia bacterium]|nr:permease [Verrucomicrobiota bacterium]MCG2678468.1 permease [Kiritimatiellia bacterium]MBU4248070.1 permease [Verrucomicrobiota bacterium]MBU4290226.1 permease [Verrucomicrobiota bacterium]MBU4430217.1 permease [Verrucomicrobiota bacterium]
MNNVPSPGTKNNNEPLAWARDIRSNAWHDPVPLQPEPPPLPPLGKSLKFMAALLALAGICFFGDRPDVRSFSLVFVSIVLEAIPFMLVGACVGGLIEVFVSRERLATHLPRRPWAMICLAAALGIVFPVCECAVVPVVRRLTGKGLPLAAAVAYLLGGPIVNPIVAVSTMLAYNMDWWVAAIRLLCGYAIAVFVALAMGRLFARRPALLMSPGMCEHAQDNQEAAAREIGRSCCGHGAQFVPAGLIGKLAGAFRHASDDFLAVAHYLVIGAAVAALAQTLVDRRLFLELTALPMVPSLLMMGLAILLNLCSEADAFIAASFRGLLSLPAQMAFMLTGPMFDLKLLLMYRTVFTRRAIIALAGLILLAVLVVVAALETLGMGMS